MKSTDFHNELVVKDFFYIPDSCFQNADVVINFVAIVHKSNITNKTDYYNINYKLAVHNAVKAKRAEVKFYIQFSSVAVYGNQTIINIHSKPHPITAYAISKLKADEALINLRDERFKVSILRPPMVYGGEETPGNMMRLIHMASTNIPLPFKCIENKRDFIHVKNLIQYLDHIIHMELEGIHLMTDQEPVSTAFLLKTIYEYLDRKPKFIKAPYFVLKLLKFLRPALFNKLFNSLAIESNLPSNACRERYSVSDGLHNMVTYYLRVKTSNSQTIK